MAGPMKTVLVTAAAMAGLGTLVAAAVVWSGAYNVAADVPHSRPVHAVIEATRRRSIAVRAAGIQPPDLASPARIRQAPATTTQCAAAAISPPACRRQK